jgi:hypothetical protein
MIEPSEAAALLRVGTNKECRYVPSDRHAVQGDGETPVYVGKMDCTSRKFFRAIDNEWPRFEPECRGKPLSNITE